MAQKSIERVQSATDWVSNDINNPASGAPVYTTDPDSAYVWNDSAVDVAGLAADLQASTGITHRSSNPPGKPRH